MSGSLLSNSVPVTSVTLDHSSLSIEKGHTASLSATVCPDNATNKNVNWTSSNNAIATVCDGVVTAVAKGSARITATAADGSGKSDYCSVNVTSDVLVSSITVVAPSKNMTVGDSAYFTASVLPINATKKSVCWSSENSDIASVNPDSGLVYAKAPGTTTIYATACDGSGIEDCCQITVTPRIMITSIEVDPSTKTMHVGDICYCFFAMAYPSTATDRRIRWTSNDSNIATVDSVTGIVTARAVGTTFIYANAIDGSGISGYCEVTILPLEATSVTLNKTTATLSKEETVTLKYIVSPHKATVTSVSWESDANSIASVSNGVVTANKDGVANITVTINGNLTATCKVIVDSREKVTVKTDSTGSYGMIVFSNGKVWNCMNRDLINDYNLNTKDAFSQRFYDNAYQTKVIDNETELVYYYPPMKEYTDNEIKLIYTLDPYGLAAYVKEYAKHNHEAGCSEQETLEGILEYKDRIFELLYKRKPRYYARNSAGTWVSTTDKSNLKAVVSESEYLFGFHGLWDTNTFYEILSAALDLLVSISGMNQILLVDWSAKFAKCALNLWAGRAPFDLQDIAEYIAEDKLKNEITDEISSWATYISLMQSLEKIKKVLSDRPYVYLPMLDFCSDYNQDIVYNILFELSNGEKYSAKELASMK